MRLADFVSPIASSQSPMSNLKQVHCPSCNALLRFRAPSSDLVAMNCPTCQYLFEVKIGSSGSASSESSPPFSRPAKPTSSSGASAKTGSGSLGATSSQPLAAKPALPSSAPTVVAQPISENVGSDEELNLDFDFSDDLSSLPPAPTAIAPKTKVPVQTKNAWMMPLGIVGGLVLVILVGSLAFLASFRDGQSFLASRNPFSSSPERVSNRLNAHILEYAAIIQNLSQGGDRSEAAQQLDALENEIAGLVFTIAQYDTVDSIRHQALVDIVNQGNQQQLDAMRLARQLERDRSAQDPLDASVQNVNHAVNAAQEIVTRVLKKPTEPDTDSERICYDGILLERDLLRCLANARRQDDLPQVLEQLHTLIDRFNNLAQQQAQSGVRVGFVPNDYQGMESAGESVRRWLVERIHRKLSPDRAFELALEDLDYVERRFDSALSLQDIASLANTSKERVQSKLGGSLASAKPPPATTVAANDSTTSTPPSTPGQDENNPFSGGRPAATAPQDQLASNPPAASERVHNSEPHGTSLAVQPTTPDSSATAPSASLPASRLPSNLLTGPNSLTIRIEPASGLDGNLLGNQLASKLGASRRAVHTVGPNLMLNFRYSGDLTDVAPLIDFGKIDLTDSQSRTIYVDGSRR